MDEKDKVLAALLPLSSRNPIEHLFLEETPQYLIYDERPYVFYGYGRPIKEGNIQTPACYYMEIGPKELPENEKPPLPC